MNKKGFTLIELLVVIAIIAILSVVLVLTLNPAELLRQARDSNRVSDLATLKSAISLYLADASSPSIISDNTFCFVSGTTTVTSGCSNSFSTSRTARATTSDVTNGLAVDGKGWIPVNFTSISSGAPIGNLPKDPTNTGNTIYRYAASSTELTFEIDADLESSKYTNATTGHEATDGGSSSTIFEVGTAPGLAL